MLKSNKLFLTTGLSQIETVKVLVDKIKPSLEFLTYNIRRYKIPVTMVMFYTEVDISKSIEETMRLTDVLKTVKIGKAYFSFVLLPFTQAIDSYTFIKHEENNKLNNIEHYYHFERLEPQIYNYFNFINSFLFKVIEKKESAPEL